MKILLLTLLTIIQAHALSPVISEYCNNGNSLANYAVKTIFEKKFCSRMYPSSIKESFDHKHDYPHSEINLSLEPEIYISKYKTIWESNILDKKMQHIHLSDHEILSALDWDEVLTFNLKAKKIVEESNSKDFIRDFYANNLNRKTKRKLNQLIEEMTYFFSSTNFSLTYGLGAIPKFHPLFTELLLEQFYFIHKNNNGLVRGNQAWLSLPKINDFEKGALTLELINYYLYDKSDSFSRYTKITHEEEAPRPEHQVSNTLMFVNIGSLLSMVSDVDCGQWGFKPATHRQLIQALFSSYKNFEGEDLFRVIIKKNIKACGSIEVYQNDIPYPLSPYYGNTSQEYLSKKHNFIINVFEKYTP